MKKVAVVVHGWPVPVNQSNQVAELLIDMGFKVYMPEYMKMRDDFSPTAVVKLFKKLLKNKKPDLLVGVSLGGLLVPFLAKEYPKAKLLIIASGYEFSPKMKWFEKAVKGIARRGESRMVRILGKMPWWMWSRSYKMMQQVDKNDWKKLKVEVENYGKAFKQIRVKKQVELARFLSECDNAPLLKHLKNKVMILAGRNDKLMPFGQAKIMKLLIKDCKLVVNNATHYRVLDKEAEKRIYEFVS